MEDVEAKEERNEKRWLITWNVLVREMITAGYLAAPMVAVASFQYLLQFVLVIMVGHLGQLPLSSVAIATSLTNTIGFSLLSGLVGGLDTLCGQACGAEQYEKLGVYAGSAIISLNLVCIPVSVMWIFMDKFLILIGQDQLISLGARKYSVWLIPALFGGATAKPLVRYLQSQSLVSPMLITSFLVLCFHLPLAWALIFKADLGIVGAAASFSISNWLYVILLILYIKYSARCKNSKIGFSKDAVFKVGEFFRFAVPSAVMVCLKWWSLEVLVLLSGLLPNPKLETSVLSICLTVSALHFTIAYGIGAAASIRVSNELGAGNPQTARVAVWAAMILAAIEAVTVSLTFYGFRHDLGHAFSNEHQVVSYISAMTPLICLSIVMDSFQGVISGVARGCGWQHKGAYVNVGAFYVIGVPSAIVLGFVVRLKAKGLWGGMVIGTAVQSTVLSFIAAFTNWQNQANKARERIFEGKLPVENEQKITESK